MGAVQFCSYFDPITPDYGASGHGDDTGGVDGVENLVSWGLHVFFMSITSLPYKNITHPRTPGVPRQPLVTSPFDDLIFGVQNQLADDRFAKKITRQSWGANFDATP
jgi:hypothetical protein